MERVRRPSPFLEQVRTAIRVRHYSILTEESYLFWVRRFILFHGKRHPRELGESQVGEFLTHLAVDRKVSASTQNQALNALVFLYKAVLERPLGDVGGVVRARRSQRLPVILHVREVKALCVRGPFVGSGRSIGHGLPHNAWHRTEAVAVWLY
ncbi:MAG: phage integrase N-terminal SAM-like domain-containing protein [Acidobacteria bacterium]|nr:phage integrase N-terminal SAM-like domain-containing protein [Acidobacteriota bacterium]